MIEDCTGNQGFAKGFSGQLTFDMLANHLGADKLYIATNLYSGPVFPAL
jgi:hypothetical protein